MKTHKKKVGRKTREFNREKYIAELKSKIYSIKQKRKKVDARLKERNEYIQKLHNFIGTKKLKEFKKSSLFHRKVNG